ncbi:MAG: heavy-metal-associated domain-containing protein [Pseudanabaena sp.]|jgi:copper chaperone|nr:heavy-metal-associated domain-containing protein [Nitrosomonadaceae bacterium]
MSTQQITFTVEGMTCGGCVKSVTNVLSRLSGVSDVAVDLANKRASFQIADGGVSVQDAKNAIEDAGFLAR